MKTKEKAKFETGNFCTTHGVYEEMGERPNFASFVQESLFKHITGDWGDVHPDDKELNDLSIEEGSRILSVYTFKDGNTNTKIWIITEADRSATTVLFPNEY